MEDKRKIELTPLEATRLVEYIQKHPFEYIQIEASLGIGIGEFISVSSNDVEEMTDITDYDSV